MYVLLLLWLFELSYAPPPGLQQFHQVSRSTTVLASVDVCVACVACASTFLIWVIAFVFPMFLLRESTCILLSSSAYVPFSADAVEDAPNLRKE